jgi:hypothetical protein
MIEALAAALLLGGINTIADFALTELKLEARPIYVLVRVVLIRYCIGGIVGARARQLLMGTVAGLMIGALVSAVYYLLAPSLGWGALAAAWSVFWLAFSLLDALLHGGTVSGALLQAVAAVILSGGFYYGITNIWPLDRSADPTVWRGLFLWSASFFPGFVVLFWRRL